MYTESLRYTKGLGDTAMYARLLYGAGFWDFTTGAESVEETAGCKVFLSEVATTSPVLSWYSCNFDIPQGGPFPVEIILDATGEIIGDDFVEAITTAAAAAGLTARGITREQFAIKVLSVLGIYDRGNVDAEDQQNVLDAYDALYQELKDDGLVTWAQGEGESIPFRFLNSLVVLTAVQEALMGTYPQPADKAQRLLLRKMEAERTIRRQLASSQDVEETVTEYF